MEKSVMFKADTRGHANHGWLDTYHTFSFADYYNPARMSFGLLRVLNDDTVAPGMGFGTHPHENMEIVSIPLEGDLKHGDSMGNSSVIRKGDIQVMSAGTGVLHSEYNANTDREVKFLQIWVFPDKKNVKPRYGQISVSEQDMHNRLAQIVSPNPDDAGAWIHQQAWFHLGRLDKGTTIDYTLKRPGDGVFTFVIEGHATVNGKKLDKRDGLGIWNTDRLQITADTDTEVLLIEVPMK